VRRVAHAAAAVITVGTALVVAGTTAVADDITPVGLATRVAGTARLHRPLTVSVGVTADPSVLDTRTAPLRVRVKLAAECGGEFADTQGTVLLDKRLSPQPAYGHAYSGTVTGTGRPRAYGVQTVCVYLEEEGDDRQFATDTTLQVDVSKRCTTTAARYDRAVRALRRASGAGAVRKARHRRHRARRVARRACGPGVPL
jgi:hypothetical protein